MNAANSLIPLILRFLPQKRNLLIPLGLSGIMQQRRYLLEFVQVFVFSAGELQIRKPTRTTIG